MDDELGILIVENDKNWQDALVNVLSRLGNNIKVTRAETIEEAEECFDKDRYELVIFDLFLPQGNSSTTKKIERIGIDSLSKLRANPNNQLCGLIILTGFGETASAVQALREYKAFNYFEKTDFDTNLFLQAARSAIFESRLKKSIENFRIRCQFTIHFQSDSISGSEVRGPNLFASKFSAKPASFESSDLAQRGDRLNFLITRGGPDMWRPEAKSLGTAVYEKLSGENHFLENLTRSQTIIEDSSDLWINFSGSSPLLGVPFELINDGNEYLCRNHVFIRSLTGYKIRAIKPFHEIIDEFYTKGQILKILIVGSNSDGAIPEAEFEADQIDSRMRQSLQYLGLKAESTLLTGADATYENVTEKLRSGEFHIFHYAGHGRFGDELPEISGLILRDKNARMRVLTAADLNILVLNSNLKLVFLSCCLSAKTSQELGRGEFYGTLEALARADIPSIIGYRWTVADNSALQIANEFYKALWKTLCPAKALYFARREVAIEKGLDDETWASPVLLMQNS